MSDTYTFTTTPDDNYFQRVIEEAAKDTNFILITERNTLERETPIAVLFVKKNVLAEVGMVYPELELAGTTLGEWLASTFAEQTELPWTFALFTGDNVEELHAELVRVRNEIRRINNILNGRVMRVTVESF